MKNKFLLLSSVIALILLLLPACDARNAGSLKSFTHPYIAQYECTQATLGEENILEKYDYIHIVIVDREKLEIVFKPKKGKKYTMETVYRFDEDTHEFTAEIGILGYRFRQTTKIEDGKFTIGKQLGRKQLIMNFQMK